MKRVSIILGPPGTGKTTTLLRIVEDALNRGVPPERIAYLAFTRKAAYEAQERAMAQFGFDEDRFPYFRTLHSLAFKELGLQRDEVMTDLHYRKIGKAMGIEFKGIYDEQIGLHTGFGLGDKCSRVDSLARVGLRSLDEQWRYSNTSDLNYHAVRQYSESLKKYKEDSGLLDFTDMLAKYNSPLPVDICIIDEAQDLSSLQYRMAIKASSLAEEIYIAGDDDQAIFGWAGADVTKFLSLKGDKHTLPQSFRIPRKVHKLAFKILSRIQNRYAKPWSPRTDNGQVAYVSDEQQIDFSKLGTWMLLSRSRYLMTRFEKSLRQQGYAYNKDGKSSLESDETEAITSWERLRKGEPLSVTDAKNISQFLPNEPTLENLPMYFVNDLGLTTEHLNFNWMDILKRINAEEREYLRSCLRNGEKFKAKPRITISTIHQSKGGEADHVALLTDMGKLSWEQSHTDEENRVWYVAVTRAKESLHLVAPRTLKNYEI